MWASGHVTETDDRFCVLDLTVYDTTGAVAMSIQRFRFMPLKAQPPASGLYEVRWVETPTVVEDADPSASDEALQVSLVALCGCSNLSYGVVESLGAAGMSSVIVDSLTETPMTAEQWAAAGTLVVPILRVANMALMLGKVLDLLQVHIRTTQQSVHGP